MSVIHYTSASFDASPAGHDVADRVGSVGNFPMAVGLRAQSRRTQVGPSEVMGVPVNVSSLPPDIRGLLLSDVFADADSREADWAAHELALLAADVAMEQTGADEHSTITYTVEIVGGFPMGDPAGLAIMHAAEVEYTRLARRALRLRGQ